MQNEEQDPIATDSLDALIAKFHALWLRGSGWRLEIGEVLYQIKEQCEHGEWGQFLADYDPRAARYLASIRQQETKNIDKAALKKHCANMKLDVKEVKGKLNTTNFAVTPGPDWRQVARGSDFTFQRFGRI